ncbi:quinone-dependent dihydroorotate dehydrogenase [Saccharibacillus sp. CPCC 101409]|uniref:quinone-dependent dihydroorotate dehydrogenase n=1 Tax=Saccharibacillus sp. CPCC 101409 TaxID=3058041 RepID=UPI00267157A6|nr:quinone-dependent dihydroorotate dehydrogenase [Saccharibacillus sp. CPCC 101409]MDO3410889.1 quinone-dependent dihydroorotate dehydrogenase [Saccharibacillus sp. CPCC 101409]
MLYRSVAKPLFFRMDPEKAHHLVIDGMRRAAASPGGLPLLRGMYGVKPDESLAVEVAGLSFPSPVGLAAGLDKNAEAVPGFSSIGFGFMEVGTVTPLAQPGNEQPRLFRLPPDGALVNRMGFNNEGAEAMAGRLAALKSRPVPIGVNIGKNKVTPNEEAHLDYERCIRTLYPHADFFVVNISSPNTPDLRRLQHGDELKLLLSAVAAELSRQAGDAKPKPVFVKIAPDLGDEELEQTVDTIAAGGVSGLIATNTTLSREGLAHDNRRETGGLSGMPLRARSTEIVRRVYAQTNGRLPIVGSGGIFTAEDAYAKIRAGASLVEIYTALIYEGPEVNRALHEGLKRLLRTDGFTHISQAVGADHR